MKCPFCQHDDTQVLDTRVSEEGDAMRRRRRCANCDKRFTTYERIELSMPVIVKKNGSRTEFDAAKLRASLMLALRKRPVSAEAVDAAIAAIEEKLLSSGQREVDVGLCRRTGDAGTQAARQDRLYPLRVGLQEASRTWPNSRTRSPKSAAIASRR